MARSNRSILWLSIIIIIVVVIIAGICNVRKGGQISGVIYSLGGGTVEVYSATANHDTCWVGPTNKSGSINLPEPYPCGSTAYHYLITSVPAGTYKVAAYRGDTQFRASKGKSGSSEVLAYYYADPFAQTDWRNADNATEITVDSKNREWHNINIFIKPPASAEE
ncbi:hypothetical protein JXO59_00210 [candidate division KSB1 bacterium]|nr:hypothetical protein [candidate division KSB1 bacterium]